VKLTLIVQLVPGVSEPDVQVLVSAKSVVSLTEILIEVRFVLVDVLVRVTALDEPALWKLKDVGDTVAEEPVEPLTAVPVRVTVSEVAVEVSVAVSVPEAGDIGLNVTLRVQLVLPAKEVPQVLVWLKSLGSVPEMAIPGVTAEEVVLESVTD